MSTPGRSVRGVWWEEAFDALAAAGAILNHAEGVRHDIANEIHPGGVCMTDQSTRCLWTG